MVGVMCSLFVSKNVFAATVTERENNDNFATAQTVVLGDTVKGSIVKKSNGSDVDTYKIVLTSSGTINFVITQYLEYITFNLYDNAGENLKYSLFAWNSNLKKGTDELSFNLEKGTYYVTLSASGDSSNYEFTNKFKPSGATNNEPDDDFKTATYFPLNSSFKGIITKQVSGHDVDNYKIVLDKSGLLKFTLTQYCANIWFNLYDNKGDSVQYKYFYWNDSLEKATNKLEIQLNKGTYYITIGSGVTGRYTLSNSLAVQKKAITLSKKSPNKVTRNTKSIKVKVTKGSKLSISGSGLKAKVKSGIATSNTYTFKNLNLKKVKKGKYIKIKATKSGYMTKIIKLKCLK